MSNFEVAESHVKMVETFLEHNEQQNEAIERIDEHLQSRLGPLPGGFWPLRFFDFFQEGLQEASFGQQQLGLQQAQQNIPLQQQQLQAQQYLGMRKASSLPLMQQKSVIIDLVEKESFWKKCWPLLRRPFEGFEPLVLHGLITYGVVLVLRWLETLL